MAKLLDITWGVIIKPLLVYNVRRPNLVGSTLQGDGWQTLFQVCKNRI